MDAPDTWFRDVERLTEWRWRLDIQSTSLHEVLLISIAACVRRTGSSVEGSMARGARDSRKKQYSV